MPNIIKFQVASRYHGWMEVRWYVDVEAHIDDGSDGQASDDEEEGSNSFIVPDDIHEDPSMARSRQTDKDEEDEEDEDMEVLDSANFQYRKDTKLQYWEDFISCLLHETTVEK
ncbi:hypothetical protein BU15DRAFT_63651 [Melanogaster broomeanus]|nr:hypothetical protein BU15DRAFT_63651 [Melanogaster broomeanus]